MRYKSLTNKLVIYFVVISLTALSIFAIVGYLQSKDAITDRTFAQLTSIKNVKKRQLERLFSDITSITLAIAKSNSLFYKSNDERNIYKNEIENSMVAEYVKHNDYFKKAVLIMIDGNDTLSVEFTKENIRQIPINSIRIFQSINLTNDSIYVLETINKERNICYSIYFISPLLSTKENRSGILIIELNTSVINEIMLETNPDEGVGLSGESYIVASDSIMRTKSRFIENSIMKVKVITEGFKQSLSGLNGAGLYKDYRGIEVLGSYSKLNISGLNWHILAEIDVAEANKPVIKMRNKLAALMLVISTAILFVTYLLSKKITIPVKNLTNAAAKIGEGIYPEPVEVISNDEIAMLSITFNNMSDKLKTQEHQLEQERLNRAKQAFDALDNERKRLSRELHDGLGQSMIATKLKLENLDINDIESSLEKIKEVKSSIDGIIEEIRHISNNLMPAVLSEFGISNALRNLCDELNDYSNIQIHFDTNFKNEMLDSKEKLYFFRVAQEAINNALQHSKATKISVSLNNQDNIIILEVKDNGIGFSMSLPNYGNGIYNMKERAKLIGAEIRIECPGSGGTIILLILKLNEKKK